MLIFIRHLNKVLKNITIKTLYFAGSLNSKLFNKDFDNVEFFSLKRTLIKYESKISNVLGFLVVTYIKDAPSNLIKISLVILFGWII